MRSIFSILEKEKGFTLIEISIVLIILGIITNFSLSFFKTFHESRLLHETQTKQHMLLRVLAHYKKKNGYLPCPATPELQGNSNPSCPGITTGIIPYQTLGLSKKDVFDAYHHYFTYGLATPQDSPRKGPRHPPSISMEQKFKIISYTSSERAPESRTADILLLSHGKNGHGAYMENGTRLVSIGKVGPYEHVNADETLTFIDFPISLQESLYHDDILIAESIENVEAKYGGSFPT